MFAYRYCIQVWTTLICFLPTQANNLLMCPFVSIFTHTCHQSFLDGSNFRKNTNEENLWLVKTVTDSCKKYAGAKYPLLEACYPRHRLALLVPRPGSECRFTLLQSPPCCTITPVVQLLEHV